MKSLSIVKRRPVMFEPISTSWVHSFRDRDFIAQQLQVPYGSFDKEVMFHPVWSQYLRESAYGKHKVNRRHVRQAQAAALFGGVRQLQTWLPDYKKRDTLTGEYLTEYHSLILEYTFPEFFRGISRQTIGLDLPSTYGTVAW